MLFYGGDDIVMVCGVVASVVDGVTPSVAGAAVVRVVSGATWWPRKLTPTENCCAMRSMFNNIADAFSTLCTRSRTGRSW